MLIESSGEEGLGGVTGFKLLKNRQEKGKEKGNAQKSNSNEKLRK